MCLLGMPMSPRKRWCVVTRWRNDVGIVPYGGAGRPCVFVLSNILHGGRARRPSPTIICITDFVILSEVEGSLTFLLFFVHRPFTPTTHTFAAVWGDYTIFVLSNALYAGMSRIPSPTRVWFTLPHLIFNLQRIVRTYGKRHSRILYKTGR